MQIALQWTLRDPADFEFVAAADFASLPKKADPTGGNAAINNQPGWIYALNCQGVKFSGYDHYAVEHLADDHCRLTCWNDAPEWSGQRKAVEVEFKTLRPNQWGAYDTWQQFTWYAEGQPLADLQAVGPVESSAGPVAVLTYDQFTPPAEQFVRHGKLITEADVTAHENAQTRLKYNRDFLEGVPAGEIVGGRLRPQAAIGRRKPKEGTRTFFFSDIDLDAAVASRTFEKEMDEAHNVRTATGLTSSGHGAGQSLTEFMFTTPANVPNESSWPAGTYVGQFNVTDAGSDMTYGWRTVGSASGLMRRLTSATAFQSVVGSQSQAAFSGTGIRTGSNTFTPSGSSASDRLNIEFASQRASGSHGAQQDYTIEVNSADSFAEGPWPTPATPLTLSESATVADAVSLAAANDVTLSESAGLADAVSLAEQITAADLTLIESATVTDAVSLAAANDVTLSEAATVTDAKSIAAAGNVTLTEAADLADVVSFVAAADLSTADSATLTDAPSLAAANDVTLSESATLADVVSVAEPPAVNDSFNKFCGLASHAETNIELIANQQDNAATTTIDDSSSNNRDLTLQGGDNTADITTTGPNSWLPAALQYTPTADYADNSAVPNVKSGFTVWGWFNSNAQNEDKRIISLGSGFGGMTVIFGTSNLRFHRIEVAFDTFTNLSVTTNQWTFFCVTGDESEITGQVDGTSQTLTLSGGIAGSGTGVSIASEFTQTNQRFSGGQAGTGVASKIASAAERNELRDGPELQNVTANTIPTSATEGVELTGAAGTWQLPAPFTGDSNGTPNFGYQWFRYDDQLGTNEVSISGATLFAYTPVAADVGKYLRRRERGLNNGGYDSAEDTFSNYTNAVAAASGDSLTLTESATVTDAVSLGAANDLTLSEAATANDATSIAAAGNVTLTEAAGLADVVSLFSSYPLTLSESATLTDAKSIESAALVTLSESGGLSDVVSLIGATGLTLSEAAALADVVSIADATSAFSLTISESLTANDATSIEAAGNVTLTEAAGLADSVGIGADVAVTLSEGATIDDQSSLLFSGSVSISESLTVADLVSLSELGLFGVYWLGPSTTIWEQFTMLKNTANQAVYFQMNSVLDGSPITTGTPVVNLVKDGGGQAVGAGVSTHKGFGQWEYVPTQAETDADVIGFQMTLPNAVSQSITVYTNRGASLVVSPIAGTVPTRSENANQTLYVGEIRDNILTVLDGAGNPVDLSARTLRLDIEDRRGVDVETIADANLAISGAGSNVVTWRNAAATTATRRRLVYTLWDITAPTSEKLLGGEINVKPATAVDA